MTTELRQALALADGAGRPLVLLATLPGERHGLALQLTALYLASWGAGCRSLGVDTPPEEIARAAIAQKADVVGISVSLLDTHANLAADLRTLRDELPSKVQLWLGGQACAEVELPDGAEVVSDWATLEQMLKVWSPG
jgi:methylmalonyl-CoA mutase cobalamin-binding subunit